MTTFEHAYQHRAGFAARLANLAAEAALACWRRSARRRQERRAIAHLRSLNDRALADIGITRAQIVGAVRGTDADLRGPRGARR